MRSWQEGSFLLSNVSWGIHRLNQKECRKHLDPGNLEFQARPITPSQIKDNHLQPCAQRVPAGLQILPCSWPNRFTANEESGSVAPSRLPVPSEQMEEPWELRATERWAFPLSWLDFYSHTHERVRETASRKSSKNWYSDPKQEHFPITDNTGSVWECVKLFAYILLSPHSCFYSLSQPECSAEKPDILSSYWHWS